ncbi:MAG: UvrD-helicase domain-containing protein [Oscillospiraceae bacterium]|nr:UvrD-helicase domain-containing protein [Oscillospiraceae bacterium]
MRFTKEQRNAIESDSGTILVSAGAGSGKTSVLTERIIQKISGGENDYSNVTDFLVVTFTRASANDLKNKISNAINKKLAEDINNAHLKRQQILLGRANISTIHSFCLDLIKSNFEKLGIPAKFRLADQNEMSIIKRNLLDALLDKYYTRGSQIYENKNFTHEDFITAIENFLGARNDENIYGVILKMREKIISQTENFKLFDSQIEIMREITDNISGFFSTKFGENIRDLLKDGISDALTEIKKITSHISSVRFEILDKKYSGTLENSREFFLRLSEIIEPGYPYSYNDAYNLCRNYENIKVGSNRINKDDIESLALKETIDKKNKYIRDYINYIQKLFSHDFSDIKRFAGSYEKSLIVLKDFIGVFDAELSNEKIRLKSFEFSDLERFAVKLLVERIGGNGEIYETELAKRVKNNFKEIYIDEYQDTNKMQDIIFRAISKEPNEPDYIDITGKNGGGNRFMVGDIKQSIYAFRGAKPDIFAGYSKAFEEYNGEESHKKSPRKIYLRKNFRSAGNIIDFINYIFTRLFSEKLGGIEYKGGEVLEAGTQTEEFYNPAVKFALVEKSRGENIRESEENPGDYSDDAEIFDSENYPVSYETDNNNGGDSDILESVVSTEAEYVALIIRDLLNGDNKLRNGQKILPRHITILMRGYKKSGIYADALKKYGVACYTDKSQGFLSSAEIMLIVSLLKTIDNPTRDIDLAAVLRSPLFDFSLDDLIYIKKFPPKPDISEIYQEPLYKYIKLYSESGEFPELRKKCLDFTEKLNLWRAKSRILPVDKLIWYLYRQTDITAKIALENFAAERKANLMLLYEYARKFEETTFRGLYGFLNYLNDVQNGRDDFEKAKIISENSDVVKIMSIHKSKGLEFPVCILADTGGLFNRIDYQGNPVMSDEGVYFDLKYGDEIGIEKTPFKKLFSEKIKSGIIGEEARILYVALTRAADRLIITGGADNINQFLEKNSEVNLTPAGFSGMNNMLKWLTAVLLDKNGKNKTDIDFEVDLAYSGRLREMIADSTPVIISGDVLPDRSQTGDFDGYSRQLRRMYDFEYKKNNRLDLSKIPAKVLVTKLKPGVLNNFEDEYALQALKETEMSPLPRFLEETGTDSNLSSLYNNKNIKDAPALAGTAAHMFMQFADFEYAEIFGAENEAENLLSKGFLSEAQFSRIKFYPLNQFFASDLYTEIKSAKRVYRETPFNLKVSANDYYGDNYGNYHEEKGFVGEYILVQGAIDLFFEDKAGRVYVVDFKTDQVHRPDGEKILIRRHKRQIKYYCIAVGEILGKPVDKAYIYSFALNQAIEVG